MNIIRKARLNEIKQLLSIFCTKVLVFLVFFLHFFVDGGFDPCEAS